MNAPSGSVAVASRLSPWTTRLEEARVQSTGMVAILSHRWTPPEPPGVPCRDEHSSREPPRPEPVRPRRGRRDHRARRLRRRRRRDPLHAHRDRAGPPRRGPRGAARAGRARRRPLRDVDCASCRCARSSSTGSTSTSTTRSCCALALTTATAGGAGDGDGPHSGSGRADGPAGVTSSGQFLSFPARDGQSLTTRGSRARGRVLGGRRPVPGAEPAPPSVRLCCSGDAAEPLRRRELRRDELLGRLRARRR